MSSRWRHIDQQLILASCLTTRRERAAAIQKIAAQSGRKVGRLYERGKFLGLMHLDSGTGIPAAANWLRHMKALIRTYSGNMSLHYAVMKRYEDATRAQQAFLRQTYSTAQAAGLLQVSRNAIVFWADVLEALHRDEQGRFSGAELRRFWMEDKYLLVAVRTAEYRKATGSYRKRVAYKPIDHPRNCSCSACDLRREIESE